MRLLTESNLAQGPPRFNSEFHICVEGNGDRSFEAVLHPFHTLALSLHLSLQNQTTRSRYSGLTSAPSMLATT